MNYYLGIDLGSTTTKAVALDEDGAIVGRGTLAPGPPRAAAGRPRGPELGLRRHPGLFDCR